MAILDEHSKFVRLSTVHYKAIIATKVLNLLTHLDRRFHTSIRVFRSEQGTEFLRRTLQDFFTTQGMHHELSNVYFPS